MKFLMKLIKWTILTILIIAIISSSFIYLKGKKMYEEALAKAPLSEYVEELRNNKNYLTLEHIPKDYRNAVIAVEDHRFITHNGFDIWGTLRAIMNNIITFSAREGGSTITQQLAKELCFTQEKALSRKVAEILLAMDLEKDYSKDDILELYINKIYYGDGYYGIKTASLGYYKKLPNDLNFSELTTLAGVPNAPSVYAPTKNPHLAKQRQKQVLYAMLEYEYINREQFDEFIK